MFLSEKPDTVPLPATFIARPRFAEADALPATASGEAGDLFEKCASDNNDPHNTGKSTNKRKRDTKLDEVRSMLEERSKAFLVQTEKLQREEMRERREQHNETMQLMKALILTLAKTNN
ncbi:hypothetical protein GN244_ATG12847 [Phytophthora infestans]|uniref:Uncharacterized protein n=1 Tax=Phytophthora infestans TaxID=4787 RepID=A0A833SKG1_PHYIN|nr:hypothetical protein GN244_ATG12847 [Phytophthora infestans]